MSQVNEQLVRETLKTVIEPDSGQDIVSLDMVSGLVIKDGNVGFAIEVDPKKGEAMEPLRQEAESKIHALDGVVSVTAVLTAHSEAPAGNGPDQAPPAGRPTGAAPQPGRGPGIAGTTIPGIKAIVAVASGKGGVGKSTIAANLALALGTLNLKIGMMDADIYGPSQPRMLGISGQPTSEDGKTLKPLENYGIKCMSMGFMVPDDTPMIWRGPMVTSAIQQMLRDVDWGELDVLVVDMPPGTGDAQLSMSQQVPLAGAIIVSTPQDIALMDARKGLNMFRKVDVPVLGIIENMSLFVCPKCGEVSHIFSHGGARREAERLGVEFLGEVPLDMEIRETSDSGRPVVVSHPEGEHAKTFVQIAERVRDQLDAQQAGGARPAPKIVMQ
ncbi:MAG: Mrp/NBP35 family ATP-binding protein [Kiloniellales bacterium]